MADDSMATPLSKLPPPVITSRADAPPLESNPTYQDILGKMDTQQQNYELPPAPTLQSTQQPVPMQYQTPPPQTPPPQYYSSPPPPPPPAAAYYQIPPSPRSSSLQRPLKPTRPKAKAPILSVETMNHPHVWLVAALVFLVNVYGIPKMQVTFPSVVDPVTGTTRWIGLAGISVVAAIAFALLRRFV